MLSSVFLCGYLGSLRSQPPDLPIIHEGPTLATSAPSPSVSYKASKVSSKVSTRAQELCFFESFASLANFPCILFFCISRKVDPWMHNNNNSGDSANSTSDNPQGLFTESSTLETMLATMSALVEENRLLRGQVTNLSSEIRRLTSAQEDQQAAVAKLTAAVVPHSKFSGHNRSSSSGSKPGQLSPKAALTNKPKASPPMVRRAASMDRSTHNTPIPKLQRSPATSPKSVL